MTKRLGRLRVSGAAGVVVLGFAGCVLAGSAHADSTPSPVASGEEGSAVVLGSVPVDLRQHSELGNGTALVHGVRRVPGGTVLYYSYGLPPTTQPYNYWYERAVILSGGYPTIVGPVLVDVGAGTAYAARVSSGGTRMQTPNESAAGGVAGTYQVLYAVMPELPAATRAVQVVLGQGEVISDVPVQDGLLEPTVPGSDPVPLGTGWPTVDLGGLSAAREPGVSTLPLRTTIVSLDGALTNRSTRDEVSVDLSADVLFAVDKATLTARAGDQIRKAAAQVNAGAAGGRVAVVGYTDATGTTAHNLDLSKRRAQAVAAALKPLLTGADVTLSVDGKGEADPLADNGTDDGRRQNRRVSIVFTKAAP